VRNSGKNLAKAGWLLVVGSCILVATGLVIWTSPDVEVAVGEVRSVRTDANLWDFEGWSAAGAIPSSESGEMRIWVGTATAGQVVPDVAPIDQAGGSASRLTMVRGATPGNLPNVIAMVEPQFGEGGQIKEWRWSTVSSALNIEIVEPSEGAESISANRVRWWQRVQQQPLVALLDDENPSMTVNLPIRPDNADFDTELLEYNDNIIEDTPDRSDIVDTDSSSMSSAKLSWVEVPSWCLSGGNPRRFMALDPRTGVVLDNNVELRITKSETDDATSRSWAIFLNNKWQPAERGMVIEGTADNTGDDTFEDLVDDNFEGAGPNTHWTVSRCPDVSWRRDKMPVLEVRWHDVSNQEHVEWFSPKVGETPVVIGGVLLARRGPGNSIAVSRYREAADLRDFSDALPSLQVEDDKGNKILGEFLLPVDKPVTLLIRNPGEGSGNLLRVVANKDPYHPRLKLTWLRNRYSPGADVIGRAIAFSSAQPGAWRYLPERAVARVENNMARLLIPGIAEFKWNGETWESLSEAAKKSSVAGREHTKSAQFETAGHQVQVSVREMNPYINWVVFLTIVQVLTVIAMAVFLGLEFKKPKSGLDIVAVWLIGLTVGVLTGVGTMQITVAGLSPLGQNSTLFLGGHLSWITIGSVLAWLVIWSIKEWRNWSESGVTSCLLGATLLGAGPVLMDGVLAPIFLPATSLKSWSISAPLIIALGGLSVLFIVLRRWLGRIKGWLTTASLMAIVGVLALHVLAGRSVGSKILKFFWQLGPLPSGLALLGVLVVSSVAAYLLFPLIWKVLSPLIVSVRKSIREPGNASAGASKASIIANTAVFSLLLLLSVRPGGPVFQATLPDGVAMFVCFMLAREAFNKKQGGKKVIQTFGHWAALALFLSGLISGDLGTTLVRTVAVLITTWWSSYHFENAQQGRQQHLIPPAVAVILAIFGAGIWSFVIYGALIAIFLIKELLDANSMSADDGGERKRAMCPLILNLIPLWIVGGLFAGMATRGIGVAAQGFIDKWLPGLASQPFVSKPIARLTERDLCAGNTELWGFCEQLLDARRYWSTRLTDWPSDVIASNMHSDLAWAHSIHLGTGIWWVIVLAVLSAIAVAVPLYRATNDTRSDTSLKASVLAGASGAAMVPLFSVALHLLGTRTVVPLSGVPWPLLSFANTSNALVIIFLAVIATLMWRTGRGSRNQDNNTLKAVITGTSLVVFFGAMVAFYSLPGKAMDWDLAEPPVLLDSWNAPKTDNTLQVSSNESWQTVCDEVISPVRMMGYAATTGSSQLVGNRFVRLVKLDDHLAPESSMEIPHAAALVSGWFLPDDGVERTLCSDPSCDWFVDPAFGAAKEQLAIKRAGGRTSVRLVASIFGDMEPIGNLSGQDSTSPAMFEFQTTSFEDDHEALQRELGDLNGFTLRTTGGNYLIVPVRVDSKINPGTALCIAVGPHVTFVPDGTDQKQLKVGLWPNKGHSSLLVAIPKESCTKSSCSLRAGWPSKWKDVQAPSLKRYAADVRQAAWEQVRSHSSARLQFESLSVPKTVGPPAHSGLKLQGLATLRSDTPGGRRIIRSSLARMLSQTERLAKNELLYQSLALPASEEVPDNQEEQWLEARLKVLKTKNFAQVVASSSPDPAISHRPLRAREESLANSTTRRLELRWVDQFRSFGAPLVLFLQETSMGVGRPAAFDSKEFFIRQLAVSEDAGYLRLPTPRPALRMQGRWDLKLGLFDQGGTTQNVDQAAVRLDPVATFKRVGEPGQVDDAVITVTSDKQDMTWKVTKAVREDRKIPFVDDTSGWKGWLARAGMLKLAPDTPLAQSSRTQRRSTVVVVRDLLADLDAFASRQSAKLTLDADAQLVMEHELLGWLSDAMYQANDSQVAVDGTIRATGFLVDYQRHQILAVAEAVGSPQMAAEYSRPQYPPLMVDGYVELASTMKPISAFIGTVNISGTSAFSCPRPASEEPRLRLPTCFCPGGHIDMAAAMQESCNSFVPQWLLFGAANPNQADSGMFDSNRPVWFFDKLESMGLFGPMRQRSKFAAEFDLDLESKRRFQFEIMSLVPRNWASALGHMYLEEHYSFMQSRGRDQGLELAQARLSRWANGLNVRASPWWSASVYAGLAATLKSSNAAADVDSGYDKFRWLRFVAVDGDTPLLESEQKLGGLFKQAAGGWDNSPIIWELLQGMAGSLQFGTGSDNVELYNLAKRFHLIGKTGTSTSGAHRHWLHLVSLVDPRSSLSNERPWLLWVTVEQVSENQLEGSIPHMFRPTYLAARLWSALGGEPLQ